MKNIMKNITFAVALVDNAFNAEAPRRNEKPNPRIINIKIIDKPYIIGPLLELFELFFFGAKNETVNGIIGKTHGVNIAARPAKKDAIKKVNIDDTLSNWLLC
tara:strand:- start:10 stop:318 length:309 start_codon:yes stop_codon:yes gene_type:complete